MSEEPTPARDTPGAIGSVLAIVVGAAAILTSGGFSDLGAVFPRAIGGLMVAMGVLYLVLHAAGRTQRGAPAAGSNLRRAGVAAVMLAWALALVPLGFLVSSAIAFVLLLMLANHDRWTPRTVLLYGGAGALVLGGLYLSFKQLLQVPLP